MAVQINLWKRIKFTRPLVLAVVFVCSNWELTFLSLSLLQLTVLLYYSLIKKSSSMMCQNYPLSRAEVLFLRSCAWIFMNIIDIIRREHGESKILREINENAHDRFMCRLPIHFLTVNLSIL